MTTDTATTTESAEEQVTRLELLLRLSLIRNELLVLARHTAPPMTGVLHYAYRVLGMVKDMKGGGDDVDG